MGGGHLSMLLLLLEINFKFIILFIFSSCKSLCLAVDVLNVFSPH